jgi:hypothetical protein
MLHHIMLKTLKTLAKKQNGWRNHNRTYLPPFNSKILIPVDHAQSERAQQNVQKSLRGRADGRQKVLRSWSQSNIKRHHGLQYLHERLPRLAGQGSSGIRR